MHIDFVLYLNEIILIFSFVSGYLVQYYIWDMWLYFYIISRNCFDCHKVFPHRNSIFSYFTVEHLGKLQIWTAMTITAMAYGNFFFLEDAYFSVKFLIIYSVSLGTYNDLPNVLASVYSPTITEDSRSPTTSPNLAFLFHFVILLSR